MPSPLLLRKIAKVPTGYPTTGLVAYWDMMQDNLLLHSEQQQLAYTIDQTSWSVNAAVAPDGQTTADALTEDGTASSWHAVRRAWTFAAGVWTYSLYAKANTRSQLVLRAYDGASFFSADFDLLLGTVLASSGATASILLDANGFYRISITFTAVAGGGYLYIDMMAGGSATYSGDGTSNFYVWGAQLNPGTSARPYQLNTDMQSLTSLYNKTPTLQRGATSGAEASDGSYGLYGWGGVTDDYYLGSALPDGTMAAPFDIPLVGKFNGTVGTIVSLAATGVTTHYQRVAYNGSGQIRIGSKAGAGAETFSADLAVSTADILALRFRSDGTTLTLTNHATGTSVTLASQSPTGACRIGIGCTAGSTVANIADAITATLGTLHGAMLSTAAWTRAYRDLKARAARKGVVVLP